MFWLFVFSASPSPAQNSSVIIFSAPWAGKGTTLIMDHHTHTTVSDGSLSQRKLVKLAVKSSCNILVITDHSHKKETASWEKLSEIFALRLENPDLLLFAGIEINMPSYNGREHVTAFTMPQSETIVLPSLRIVAEMYNKKNEKKETDRSQDRNLLSRVNELTANGADIVMIYNHPSRKDKTSAENIDDLLAWNSMSPNFIGFGGAPGHQKAKHNGYYEHSIKTVDRWDPMVSQVGGVWDQMLNDGYQFWGAIAGSDYHGNGGDYAPCSFSRTHVEVSEPSYAAVIAALRAGTFWADHGNILNKFAFSAKMEGLDTPLYPGSIAQFGKDMNEISVEINIARGLGAIRQPLNVEIIGNCRSGIVETLATETLSPDQDHFNFSLNAKATGSDGKSCYIRSRIRLHKYAEQDLLAYSNQIRFMLN